jgi:hypothetical protein
LLIAGLSACALAPAGDGPPPSGPWVWSGCITDLHHMDVCELDDLFHRATRYEMPCGFYPGEILCFANLPAAEQLKRVANSHWYGKRIEADGYFINQWKGREALHSCLKVGPSLLDGCPCNICEYPRMTPLFGPMRDEYREIAPGVFLGRQYRRVPKVTFLGYNVMCLKGGGGGEPVVVPHEVIPAPRSGSTPPKTISRVILPPAGRASQAGFEAVTSKRVARVTLPPAGSR